MIGNEGLRIIPILSIYVNVNIVPLEKIMVTLTELQLRELAKAMDGLVVSAQMAVRCDMGRQYKAERVHLNIFG